MTTLNVPEVTVEARPVKKILVPLDGTRDAAAVLPYITGMAAHLKASLVLLHCVPPDLKSGVPELAKLDELAITVRKRGVQVTTVVHESEPGKGIVEASARYETDLIAMTAHAHAGSSEMIGSSAHEVLRSRVEPVLVLRPHDGLAAQAQWPVPPALIVGLDGSALATTALPHAELLAKAFDSEIVLVRAVLHADPLGGAARYYGAGDDFAERYLAGIAESLRRRGFRVATRTGHRPPDREVVSAADAYPGSIIVLSTRGLTGRPDLVLGSVTDKVVRSQRHSVLVIPAARTRPGI